MLNFFSLGKILQCAVLLMIVVKLILYFLVVYRLHTAKKFTWNPIPTQGASSGVDPKSYSGDKGEEASTFYATNKYYFYGQGALGILSALLVVTILYVGK